MIKAAGIKQHLTYEYSELMSETSVGASKPLCFSCVIVGLLDATDTNADS